jgi:hypothetical protein
MEYVFCKKENFVNKMKVHYTVILTEHIQGLQMLQNITFLLSFPF